MGRIKTYPYSIHSKHSRSPGDSGTDVDLRRLVITYAAGPCLHVCLCEQVDRSMCMESFEDMPGLGRFTLRTEGKTVAIGKILAVQKPMPK